MSVEANVATWWTSSEISETYRVGEERLLVFVARGNLPMSRDLDGERLYDVDVVARLFRRRDAANERSGTVLGGFRLGDTLPSERESSVPERRNSQVRIRAVRSVTDELPVKKRRTA